ncbi:alpha/beta hydrolase family protein [Klenkia brasiliensis]|uniref:2,6-dihydroxypseudooxynicotine hydrolase n=1 Tax=Klenkia brasiliensis TaxID=333142 RepID=A0A1G7SF00_9ACTN|nr:alpha/beta fold hydrolase [Klenkia brasiliensis]SDG20999.1 2,6-dihydroxypseudooxynicotine hydrolase [Klenkia brasiliensis]
MTNNSGSAVLQPEQEMLNWGRLILDGVPYADLVSARDRDPSVTWFEHWMQTAANYERLGETAESRGHTISAGEYFVLGSLAAQYAQFLWFDDRRRAGQERKVELYRRAAPLLNPPADRFEVTVDGATVPGYVRTPTTGEGPFPTAVLLGGLESTKEESYQFEQQLLARGIATVTFDGPGQGEMFPEVPLRGDYERYTSAVVDYAEKLPEVDSSRIGVVGRSLGGHYALRSAALDDRFIACISWGGFADMDSYDDETPMTKESWKYVTASSTDEESRERVMTLMDVRSELHKLRVPTYIQHGMHDEVPVSEVEVVKQLAVDAPLTIVIEPDGDHCCHNLGPRPRIEMVDWLEEQLKPRS